MEKVFFQNDITITDISFATFVAKGTGEKIHNNRPFHGIVIYSSGVHRYIFNSKKEIFAKENDVIYLPKNSSYYVDILNKGECYCINFDILDDKIYEPFSYSTKHANKLKELFKKAVSIWIKNAPNKQLQIKGILYEILFIISQEQGETYFSNKTFLTIKPAIDFLKNPDLSKNISVSYLAKLCKISETYFRKLFEKKYDVSPNKFITNLKITKSKELMSLGTYKISEIALLVGYTDTSIFCRDFKKNELMTPTEYVKSLSIYL